MSVTRTIEVSDITPAELAELFCKMWSTDQAKFFAEIKLIAAAWPAPGWCGQSCAIAQEIDSDGREVITKLAEHVLGYDDMLATLRQYENDLLYPPQGDSRDRRLDRVRKVIASTTGAA